MKSQNVSYGNDAVVDAWGRAWDETAAMGASVMQPGHLLLGLLGNGANAAWGVLRQLAFDIEGFGDGNPRRYLAPTDESAEYRLRCRAP